jgi:hypothetical protein
VFLFGALILLLSIIGLVIVSSHPEETRPYTLGFFSVIGVAIAFTIMIMSFPLSNIVTSYTDKAGAFDFQEMRKFNKKWNMTAYWYELNYLSLNRALVVNNAEHTIKRSTVQYTFTKKGLSINFSTFPLDDDEIADYTAVKHETRLYTYDQLNFSAEISKSRNKYKFIWLMSEYTIPINESFYYNLNFLLDYDLYYFFLSNDIEIPNLTTLISDHIGNTAYLDTNNHRPW